MIALENRAALTDEFKALAEDVIKRAKAQGATAAEVGIDKGTGLSVEVRMGTVDKLQYHRDQGMNVTVYFGHKKGYASSADFSSEALDSTVAAACRIARYTSDDEFNGLADPEQLATQFPDLDSYHPWDVGADQAIELAIQTEDTARAFDPRITNSEGAGVDSFAGLGVYANSDGFMGFSESTRHSLSCSVVAQDGDSMQRDYWYSVARAAEDLEASESVATQAAERTVKRLNGRSLSTRAAPVLFVPTVARGLMGHLVSALSGGSQYRKASFLLDSIGQRVLPDFVQLQEAPYLARALGSRAFDAEGVTPQARDVIRDGTVEGYFLGSYSARKLGMTTTGNAGGASNLLLGDTGQSFDELLADMGTGLLVSELIGHGINMMTGDYSRGAAGFWVENGEIQYPVEEITIAGNLKDMYQSVRAIGTDTNKQGGIQTGSILLDTMTIAGE